MKPYNVLKDFFKEHPKALVESYNPWFNIHCREHSVVLQAQTMTGPTANVDNHEIVYKTRRMYLPCLRNGIACDLSGSIALNSSRDILVYTFFAKIR